MAKRVWKYQLPFGLWGSDTFVVQIPKEAQLLTVQLQQNEPMLWALVDGSSLAVTDRWFRVAGTGHPIEETILGYVGTWQWPDLGLVFHLFEISPPREDTP